MVYPPGFRQFAVEKNLFMDVLRIKKDGDFSIANC